MNSSKTSGTIRRHTKATKQVACGQKHANHPYEPYVYHAACVEHQMWWRSPKLFAAAVVAAVVAIAGLTSTLVLVPELTADSAKLVFVPFAKSRTSPTLGEVEFQSRCKNAQSLVSAGDVQKGLSEFRKAEALPNVSSKLKAELFNDMAIALHQTGQKRDAVRYLEKAIREDASLVSARSNLSMILLELGDNDRASAVLNEAVRLEPKNGCLVNRLLKLTGTRKISMTTK